MRQGDQVEEGDPLVVVEAMKMEHTGGWVGGCVCGVGWGVNLGQQHAAVLIGGCARLGTGGRLMSSGG